jgi:hypothetical protein
MSENKEARLRITVDNKSTEKVLEILERERLEKEKAEHDNPARFPKPTLQEENQTLKDTLSLVAEQQTLKKLDSLGIKSEELRDKYRANPELLNAYEDGLKGKGRSSPSGTAPLNSAQWGENGQPPTYDAHGDLINKKYPSYEAMIENLHDREAIFGRSQKGLQATKMLEALTRKFFEAHKETNSPVPIYQKPLPKLVEAHGLRVAEDPSQGDLQERNRIFRRRKLLEREERASINVKGED